jgi:biotin transport system substrate-specific component
MKPIRARTKTLAAAIWPAADEAGLRAMRAVLLALVGSLVVAASAQVQVPMYPVPMTMQPFAVIVIGAAYGARLGFATLLLYIAEGAIGLPVFAGMKGGVAVLVGPTAGYIYGFALAAAAVGWLAERRWDRSILTTIAAMTIGMALIYLPGVAWLAQWIAAAKGIALGAAADAAFATGALPFLIGDAVKIVLAALVLPCAWLLVGRAGR